MMKRDESEMDRKERMVEVDPAIALMTIIACLCIDKLFGSMEGKDS